MVGALVLCASQSAHAQETADAEAEFHVALQYAVPSAACPSEAEFKEVVVQRLGYDPFRETASDHVLVTVAVVEHVLDGKLEWRDHDGRWAGDQLFPSRDANCQNLVRAMAFALAVQLHTLAAAGAPENSPSTAPAASTSTVSPKPPSPAPPQAPRESRPRAEPSGRKRSSARAVFGLGAGAAVGFGLASAPVALLRLFGTVGWKYARVELAGAAGLPDVTRRADGAGFSQQVLFAGVAGCGVRDWLSACLLANAGAVRIAGRDIDLPASHWGLLFQAGLRLAAHQQLGSHAYIAVHVDALATPSRWTVTLDSVPVWRAPLLSELVGFDVGAVFP